MKIDFLQLSRFKCVGLFLINVLLLITPDLLLVMLGWYPQLPAQLKSWLLIFAFAACFQLSPSNRWNACWLFLFSVLQIMQFSHIRYFHSQLSPYAIYAMFNNSRDVINEAGHIWLQYIWILPIVMIPFYAVYYVNSKNNAMAFKTKWSYAAMIIIALAVGFGIKVADLNLPRFHPNELRFSIGNSIKAVCGYIFIKLRKYQPIEYKSYEVTKRAVNEKMTVVLIIGESVNYKHMSLYGFDKLNTPNLNKLSKRHDFYYTTGISGAISTGPSCKFLGNVIYEPNNMQLTSSCQTNLFTLAKANGFKTFYISAQSDHMVSGLNGVQNIDVVLTYDSNMLQFEEFGDRLLVELLENQTYAEKNFIVAHQWCIHSPYAKHARLLSSEDRKGAEKWTKIETYDNVMKVNDEVISGIFNLFNTEKFGKFYIVWTSDHNELLGEEGLYGHGTGMLYPQTAQVPVIAESNDATFMSKIKEIYLPTHYELTKLLAYVIGYEIQNPNEIENVFYINGVDYNGSCGYIRVTKDVKNRQVSYKNEYI